MKGTALAWGAILAILLITSFAIIDIVGKGDLSRTVVVKSGAMISFVDNAEMIMRTFNASIPFIAQRVPYSIGKTGGYNVEFWSTSPTLDELKTNLENNIQKNLPQNDFFNGAYLTWLESNVSVIPCEPLDSSKCFEIKGWKTFNYYDSTYNSILLVNNTFDQIVDSSYFKLLSVARKIVDNQEYTKSEQELTTKYGLQFSVSSDNGVYVITITDNTCLPNEFYCLVHLLPSEGKNDINGEQIPFDYLKLTFKVKP